ncbi:MAG: PGPGW domain-containing protein [Streptosporangiales bacterium]
MSKASLDEADEVLARVLRQRERHRARPMPVRIALAVAGVCTSIVGAILLIEPELGLPVLLVGLRLLAYEFDWAARLYARVARSWQRLRERYRRLSPATKYATWIITALVVAAFIAWLVLR